MEMQELKALKKQNKIKGSKKDYIYYAFCWFILLLLALIVIYPLYYIVIASISEPDAVMSGEVWLYPIKVNFDGYKLLYEHDEIWRSYFNTLIYTIFVKDTYKIF